MFNLAYQPTGEEMVSEDNNTSLCDMTLGDDGHPGSVNINSVAVLRVWRADVVIVQQVQVGPAG